MCARVCVCMCELHVCVCTGAPHAQANIHRFVLDVMEGRQALTALRGVRHSAAARACTVARAPSRDRARGCTRPQELALTTRTASGDKVKATTKSAPEKKPKAKAKAKKGEL